MGYQSIAHTAAELGDRRSIQDTRIWRAVHSTNITEGDIITYIYRVVVVISVSIRLMQNTSELTWHIDFETKHHEFVYANDKVLEKVFDATITEAK